MISFAAFIPFEELAQALWPAILPPGDDDGAHDAAHLARVWGNARTIQAREGGDEEVIAAAVLLHDCVAVPKNSPERKQASRLAAARARELLAGLGWVAERVDAVAHAIEAHSYSAGIPAESPEARIVRDADRLDAIGYIGIARCFYTAGRMSSSLYEPGDPAGVTRVRDDARFALDHFPLKLLRLSEEFLTSSGREMAAERHVVLLRFYEGMLAEAGAV